MGVGKDRACPRCLGVFWELCYAAVMRMSPLEIAERLGQSGLCICPDFLSPLAVRATLADLDAVESARGLHRAGIGAGAKPRTDNEVRRDAVQWLERGNGNRVQGALWEALDALHTPLNQALYLGVAPVEGHYARYPVGGFYRRHLDCFQNGNQRRVTVILYLNLDWQPSDGGALVVYDPHTQEPTQISPVGGTLVCFLSQEFEHEVLPSPTRVRSSFVGWFSQR